MKLIQEWWILINEYIRTEKKFYAYCTMHKWWASEDTITLWFKANEFGKPSPYQYDDIVLKETTKYMNKVWFYNFINSPIEEKILKDWTFILSFWFMVLFPTKEISQEYLNYIEERNRIIKEGRFNYLKEEYEKNKDNLDLEDITMSDIKNIIYNLQEYIELLTGSDKRN